MTGSADDLRQCLDHRSGTVVEAWYEALRSSALAFRSPAEVRSHLWDIWDDAEAFLLSEGGLPRDAEAIGARFVPLRLMPEATGQIVRALLEELLENSPRHVDQVLRGRLSTLIEGLLAGLHQATERNLLEQQEKIREAYARSLRRAEEQLRIKNAGIESSLNAVVLFNLQGEVTYVNSAFLKMWRYRSEHQVVGEHIGRFGEWRGDIEETLRLLGEEGGWMGELVGVRADGSRFDVQASVSAVPGDGERPTHLMVFFVDITERIETQRALRQRAAYARFLNLIGEEIAGERTTKGVLERAVHLAQETFDLHQVAVLLPDRDRQVLEVAAVASPIDDAACEVCSLAVGEGITGYVAQRNETVVVGDVSTDPRYIRLLSAKGLTRSEMAVPIRIGGRVAGVLDAQSPAYDAFSGSERVVLETLADQIAVALENARLYQALQDELTRREEMEQALRRSVQRLETVHEIDQAILGAKSREEVAGPLLEKVRQLVPCERASIDVFDFEAGEVRVLAAIQIVGENRVAAGTTFPITQRQLLFEMLGQHQVVHVEDLRQLPQSSPLISALCKDGIRSALVGAVMAQGELIGMLSLGSRQLSSFKPEHKPIVAELADTVGIAMQQARLLDSIRQHRERLSRTMARLAEAEETERRHVVRELHDRVGQNLTALDINLSVVLSNLDRHDLEDLRARIDDSLSLVAQTNQMIRQLMIDLRPPVLDDYGLLPTLHWYGDRFSLRTGIAVAVRGREEAAADLSPHVENALFRIAQEALNNIAKHARADQVTIALTADEEVLRLTIRDDGAGFRPEGEQGERKSWGLLTMKERADSVGARCRIESEPGEGTCVTVEVAD